MYVFCSRMCIRMHLCMHIYIYFIYWDILGINKPRVYILLNPTTNKVYLILSVSEDDDGDDDFSQVLYSLW